MKIILGSRIFSGLEKVGDYTLDDLKRALEEFYKLGIADQVPRLESVITDFFMGLYSAMSPQKIDKSVVAKYGVSYPMAVQIRNTLFPMLVRKDLTALSVKNPPHGEFSFSAQQAMKLMHNFKPMPVPKVGSSFSSREGSNKTYIFNGYILVRISNCGKSYLSEKQF